MTVYGLTRVSNPDHDASPEVQRGEIEKGSAQFDLGEIVFKHENLGISGITTLFREREQGCWLMENLTADDTLIVWKLDRLGRTMGDILSTVDYFNKRDVRLICLQFGGRTLDMTSTVDKVLVGVFAIMADVEGDLIRQRTMAGRNHKKALGTYIQKPSYGVKKIVGADGRPERAWDEQQLAYICEIAERLAKGENVARVAQSFWDRGAKDHNNRLWGKMKPRLGLTPRGSPYEHFRKVVRWFHRAKHASELPPEWIEIAWTIPEPKGFRIQKRPKKKHGRRNGELDEDLDFDE